MSDEVMNRAARGAAEDGLRALDDRPLSPVQRRAAFLVACGEFIDGYDLLVMGAALIFLRPQFHLSPQAVGLLGASTFIGAAVGLLVFGDLSDRMGRRAIFVLNLVFFVAASIASAFIQTPLQLFIMRFLVGVGVGMDIPTSTAYLAEIAPARRRGFVLASLLNILWVIGAMTSTLIAIPLTAAFGGTAWRWMLGLAAVPAALVLLGRQTLPESPRWLIAQGRTEEARDAFARFGIDADPAMLAGRRERGTYAELFRGALAPRIGWVSLVFGLNCFTGSITSIATPLVLRSVGTLSVNATLLFSAAVWLTSLLGTFCSAALIDRLGRRRLCLMTVIPYGIVALVMAAFAQSSAVVLIGGYFLISFLGWTGPAVLVWAWGSELFPTRLRGRAQGVANACCRVTIALNIYLVPIALAGVGFGPYIALLSLPMFAIALIVSRVPFFSSERRSLEELSGAM